MQYVNLLCSADDASDLAAFARIFFGQLGAQKYEERESSHYLGGYYFHGQVEGIAVSIALSDDEDPELPYWVQFSGDLPSAELFVGNVDQIVRSKLALLNLRLVRLTNFGKHNEVRIEYSAE